MPYNVLLIVGRCKNLSKPNKRNVKPTIMNFLEKDLETIIYETPSSRFMSRGLWVMYDRIFRQVNLGAYGIADIVTVKYLPKSQERDMKGISITIYELKQKKISVTTLLQACRYFKAIEKFIGENFDVSNTNITFNIRLIGSEIDNTSDFVYLLDLINNVTVYTYSYDFDGIKFHEQSGYYLKNPQFPKASRQVAAQAIQRMIRGEIKENSPF